MQFKRMAKVAKKAIQDMEDIPYRAVKHAVVSTDCLSTNLRLIPWVGCWNRQILLHIQTDRGVYEEWCALGTRRD